MTEHELKELKNLGAELGAAKAEVDRLRAAMVEVMRQVDGNIREKVRDCVNGANDVQDIYDYCDRIEEAIAEAFSPATAPTDTFTAVDMATAAAQGFRDGQKAEPDPAQDERSDELEAIHQYAFEVGGIEDGDYILTPEELDEVVRRATEPFEDVLRALACSLGAGGYNAPTVDPTVFEQKIRWGIDQLTRPAQTEQQATVKECLTVQPVAYAVFAENGNVACFSTRRDHPSLVAFESDGHSVVSLAPIAQTAPQGKFRTGDLVKKSTGSEWVGHVCGWYSTTMTPEGYAVESEAHAGSVQIYPAKALEAVE